VILAQYLEMNLESFAQERLGLLVTRVPEHPLLSSGLGNRGRQGGLICRGKTGRTNTRLFSDASVDRLPVIISLGSASRLQGLPRRCDGVGESAVLFQLRDLPLARPDRLGIRTLEDALPGR
jgi:hypothetical protein